MPKFHVIAGPDATPAYPIMRKIGTADLKDALAKGVDDFLAMPTSLVFLGLIYPIVGMCLAGFALPLLFPLMAERAAHLPPCPRGRDAARVGAAEGHWRLARPPFG